MRDKLLESGKVADKNWKVHKLSTGQIETKQETRKFDKEAML